MTETSEYLLLFRSTNWHSNLSPQEIQKAMSQWKSWFDQLTAQGKVKAGQPLMNEGKIVSGAKGRVVADGPFAESKEAIAGYFLLQEAGKMVAFLTRFFGINRLNLAEDVVQEALLRALQTWPYYGIPRNPSAWITQTAKNLALDLIRREKVFRNKEIEIAAFKGQHSGDSAVLEFTDDRLRLMFVCCHPIVPQPSQVALALKTLCGFSTAEISRAFLRAGNILRGARDPPSAETKRIKQDGD